MRIISGKYSGKHIIPGKYFNARPTTDFAKEGLFNILRNSVSFESISVLDLFSGTGSISYEFLSLGAIEVMAVEINGKYVEFIEKTALNIGFDKLVVLQDDVLKFIPSCNYKYDIIFADPPYDLNNIDKIPDMVLKQGILRNDESIFIMEHGPNINFEDYPSFLKQRNYGKVHFSFFCKP